MSREDAPCVTTSAPARKGYKELAKILDKVALLKMNEIHNKRDVVQYLKSWLTRVPTDQDPLQCEYHGHMWTMTHGFRRAFACHQVFLSGNGQYCFHVHGERDWDGKCEPNMGIYASFDEMIDGVGDRYVKLWKLEE